MPATYTLRVDNSITNCTTKRRNPCLVHTSIVNKVSCHNQFPMPIQSTKPLAIHSLGFRHSKFAASSMLPWPLYRAT